MREIRTGEEVARSKCAVFCVHRTRTVRAPCSAALLDGPHASPAPGPVQRRYLRGHACRGACVSGRLCQMVLDPGPACGAPAITSRDAGPDTFETAFSVAAWEDHGVGELFEAHCTRLGFCQRSLCSGAIGGLVRRSHGSRLARRDEVPLCGFVIVNLLVGEPPALHWPLTLIMRLPIVRIYRIRRGIDEGIDPQMTHPAPGLFEACRPSGIRRDLNEIHEQYRMQKPYSRHLVLDTSRQLGDLEIHRGRRQHSTTQAVHLPFTAHPIKRAHRRLTNGGEHTSNHLREDSSFGGHIFMDGLHDKLGILDRVFQGPPNHDTREGTRNILRSQ